MISMSKMVGGYEKELNLKATELRLGLPGTDDHEKEDHQRNNNNKRSLSDSNSTTAITTSELATGHDNNDDVHETDPPPPPSKAQIVGWPPVQSFRRNSTIQMKKRSSAAGDDESASGNNNNNNNNNNYVKVSMDGAPYLRKIDLTLYKGYPQLLNTLEQMFKFTIGEYSEREGYKGSEYAPTYEDKDGDWMLVGDVPWEMFMSSCKRLRIMKGSEARGLGCAA